MSWIITCFLRTSERLRDIYCVSYKMIPKGSTLTLKQRLAALTQSPSPPSSPIVTSPKSPGPKRKFTAPWVKRTPSQNGNHTEFVEEDRLQLVISKLIYQAGVDYESVHPNVTALWASNIFMTERARCNVICWKQSGVTQRFFLPLM
jgi:hypothetical protein